ncbi:MAG: hypothetical protein K9L68_10990 [Spirochaetales bacterium]|nr:hypothetical protein [Spirochaetales bacterium]MCF7939111.1 hypothetical protein [Spirochaetales bacterium]
MKLLQKKPQTKKAFVYRIGMASLLFLLFVPLSPVKLQAEAVSLEGTDYIVDPPEEWSVLQVREPEFLSFTDASRQSVFQISRFERRTAGGVQTLFQHIVSRFQAEAQGEGFRYLGKPAWFGDLRFQAGDYPVRGYLICIEAGEYSYALLAYAHQQSYSKLHDQLLSALDSFAPDTNSILQPGPVSQFYSPFPAKDPDSYVVPLAGKDQRVFADAAEFDAAEVLIEREARILINAQAKFEKAWGRYYRQIYRDNYHRLERLYALWEGIRTERSLTDRELAKLILTDLQNYTYERTETPSDLLSPVEAAYTSRGDCDARALIMIILLHHFKIDAILMVSTEYGHSVAAVDVPGAGARFSFGGTPYLIAETTEQVDLGLIAADMANPEKWIGMDLRKPLTDFD